MDIPKQLKNKKFRFIKIVPGKKRPVEDDWAKSNNYKFNEPEFQEYLKTAKSYGVVCGYGNLAIIDCDTQEVAQEILMRLPETFIVKTGSGGLHFYYIIKDLDKKIVMQKYDKETKEEKHYGEIQFDGAQCIGASSLHPSGKHYEIFKDSSIKEITKERLLEVIKNFINEEEEPEFVINEGLDWDIAPLLAYLKGGFKERKSKQGVWQGTHPVHGSTTGTNLEIDTNKNLWHCFRCHTGGDTASLISVLEKLVPCDECTKNFSKSAKGRKLFKKILKISEKKYGYVNTREYVAETTKKISKKDKAGLLAKYKVYYTTDSGAVKIAYPNLVELIQKEHGEFLLISDKSNKTKDIYYYKDGFFQNIGREIIRQYVKYYLASTTTKHKKEEVLDAFNDEPAIERSELEPPVNLINVNNGVLNLNTMKLSGHSPKYRFLNKIPIDYKPKAKCPKTLKFFKEVLTEDAIAPMQEMFGYCLYRSYPVHALFILRGTGRNGKGVTLKLLRSLLGVQNITTRKLHEIATDQHARADLYCRMASLSGEMKYDDIKDNSLIKELTGEDIITARRLYKESFEFDNYAKLIFATNNLPPSLDMNVGWLDRIVFFEFPNTYDRGNKKTVERLFEDHLESEAEGLLIWAIKGLTRLLKTNKFSNQPHYDVIGDLWNSYCNTVEPWLEERIIESVTDSETLNAVYKDYVEWCREQSFSPESRISFGRKLSKAVKLKPLAIIRKRQNNHMIRVLDGAKIARKTATSGTSGTASLKDMGQQSCQIK